MSIIFFILFSFHFILFDSCFFPHLSFNRLLDFSFLFHSLAAQFSVIRQQTHLCSAANKRKDERETFTLKYINACRLKREITFSRFVSRFSQNFFSFRSVSSLPVFLFLGFSFFVPFELFLERISIHLISFEFSCAFQNKYTRFAIDDPLNEQKLFRLSLLLLLLCAFCFPISLSLSHRHSQIQWLLGIISISYYSLENIRGIVAQRYTSDTKLKNINSIAYSFTRNDIDNDASVTRSLSYFGLIHIGV